MTSKRRSPYLVLGLEFGASKRDAARAFARATRRARTMSDAPFDIEDLNWALHAVEQREEDPSTSIDDYRMPADRDAYDLPDGFGILNPEVKPYPRASLATTPADVDLLRARLVKDVAADIAKHIEGSPLPALHRFEEEGS